MSNILYYSKKCQHSKRMIINISQSPVKSQIQFICVDDLIKTGNLPSFIKSVPVIFKRDTNTLLKGEAANDWIRSFDTSIGDDNEISGFDSFGGGFSGLSEEGYSGAFSTGNAYSFIESDGSSEQNQGYQSNDTLSQGTSQDTMKSEKRKTMDNAYDRMMAEREQVGQSMKRM